jgi:hypothetical protein
MVLVIVCVLALFATAHIRSGMVRDRARGNAKPLMSGLVNLSIYVWAFDFVYVVW